MLIEKTGVTRYVKSKATPGYTLFSPTGQHHTYIIDMEGNVVHKWKRPHPPGSYYYLEPDGNLLGAMRTDVVQLRLPAPGGKLCKLDWKGKTLWEFTDDYQHHDFRRCPNGNIVYLRWELMSKKAQKRVKGGIPGTEHPDGIYCDAVREITPAGELVWEWRVAEHMDIENYPLCPICDRREMAHANTIFPLPNGNFLISFRNIHLVAEIDRKTKKFVWKMHHPNLGHQHDIRRLDNGNYMIFCNGMHSHYYPPEDGSRVIEIDPRQNNKVVWQYHGKPPVSFESTFISGAVRLWSGNTLICEGRWGRIFEVTPDGEIVWNYVSPYFNDDASSPMVGSNSVFRAFRYADDSPEIAGRLPRLKKTRRAVKPKAKKAKSAGKKIRRVS